MKYFVIFSLFIGLSGLATAQVFADGDYTEFIIDGHVITANSTYVTDISLDWDSPSLPLGNVTLKEPFTGTIEIQISKSMPRTMNLDFDTRFLLEIKNDDINDHLIDDNNTLYDDRITETESLCNYILTIKLENTEYFEFGTLSVATGRWEPVTIQNEECDDVSDETTFQNGSVFPRHGYPGWAIPPLKQFKSGISLDKIECRESLVLVTKHDGTPACVSYETGNKMIERGWGICSDLVSYDRGNPCGPHSSEVVSFDSYEKVEPDPKPTYTLTEVHCFPNQVIYNDECVYVLTPTDEHFELMKKYFFSLNDEIIAYCEIEKSVTSGSSGSAVTLERCHQISSYTISDVNVIEFEVVENED